MKNKINQLIEEQVNKVLQDENFVKELIKEQFFKGSVKTIDEQIEEKINEDAKQETPSEEKQEDGVLDFSDIKQGDKNE